MKKSNIIFLLLIISAIFLRFFQLGQNPPSLTWDEAAWGYNAYSLGIDGRDEFGRFLPYDYLESFGDFKPPVYAYLDIIPVKIFGLNEFAVRFPSALFGVLTILVTYFLVKRIFVQHGTTQNNTRNYAETVAIISSFILAISPWHINLSRAAFEANVATFFLVAGVWLFLGGAQDKKWYLPFSVLSFVISIYTFNTARIVAPLLLLILAIGFKDQLLQRKKQLIISILIGIILILPSIKFLLSPQASLRFKEVNIFSNTGIVQAANQQIQNDNNAWWSKILHNRRFAFTREYLIHYFDNLSPSFLFIKGDGNPKFSTQDVGQLYFWELPFLIAGILFLFRKKEANWWIIPLWIIIGIAPAATARETPHALRIETVLPTFQILVAYGIFQVYRKISNIKIMPFLFALFFLFLIFNFLYYFHGYYTHYPRIFSGEWQYGYKESIDFVQKVEKNYDLISVTDKLGRPYIYYLFYTKTNPNAFRKTAKIKREAFGFVTVESFSKYSFTKNSNNKNTLFINTSEEVPVNATILKTFKLLNGNPSLVAYTI